VLDSFALLAYFQAEPGGATVKRLLKEALAERSLVFLSLLNLGEIIYITERRLGSKASEETLKDILRLPVQLAEATLERVLAAAHIKAHHPVSYADAFVISLARELKATIVTADPEFQKIGKTAEILWLESPTRSTQLLKAPETKMER